MLAPIIAAPMAGGGSTPELVVAAARGGGLGFLAAGYLSAAGLAGQIAAVRAADPGPFGVNLFVPDAVNTAATGPDTTDVSAYRDELADEARRYGVTLPATDPTDTDDWAAKLAGLLADPVAVVSFTFGLPGPEVFAALHAAGTHVTVTVTGPAEAVASAAAGADSLCVQGPAAGGHRGTHTVAAEPDERDLPDLLAAVRAVVDLPLVAAGGVAGPADVVALRAAGAVAVQIGTLLLRTPESGAPSVHREALVAGTYPGTRLTRAFTGRVARGLANRFLLAHSAGAPASYPQVHQLTRPLRAAAARAGDPDGMSLWAGTGYAHATARPAADVVRALVRATG